MAAGGWRLADGDWRRAQLPRRPMAAGHVTPRARTRLFTNNNNRPAAAGAARRYARYGRYGRLRRATSLYAQLSLHLAGFDSPQLISLAPAPGVARRIDRRLLRGVFRWREFFLIAASFPFRFRCMFIFYNHIIVNVGSWSEPQCIVHVHLYTAGPLAGVPCPVVQCLQADPLHLVPSPSSLSRRSPVKLHQ
ncbi:unnamed protein product [Danaus chrysippus]|uniref:(African queen) hypothetical protein n=1 Tax=Danaus chrysippus TaxID=151541 RepID=A0A8J2QDZ2_9NEOP|nr:unnamed protein product [Danaus chrysippus]